MFLSLILHRPIVTKTRDIDPIKLLCKPLDILNMCTETIIFIIHTNGEKKKRLYTFFTDIS